MNRFREAWVRVRQLFRNLDAVELFIVISAVVTMLFFAGAIMLFSGDDQPEARFICRMDLVTGERECIDEP